VTCTQRKPARVIGGLLVPPSAGSAADGRRSVPPAAMILIAYFLLR
jgi:hypothetical protein